MMTSGRELENSRDEPVDIRAQDRGRGDGAREEEAARGRVRELIRSMIGGGTDGVVIDDPGGVDNVGYRVVGQTDQACGQSAEPVPSSRRLMAHPVV
jgi:hypothetical protein